MEPDDDDDEASAMSDVRLSSYSMKIYDIDCAACMLP
jgi:hypothetical protein